MHKKDFITGGKPLSEAKKVLIMLHGRGASATDILSLLAHLQVAAFALVALQASNNTWYPYSFMAPPRQNEPWLSSALLILREVVTDLNAQGFSNENIYFTGFSQGACLTLEFAARNATRYGGVAAFSGGLIGDKIYTENYQGDFNHTPVFIGSANPDFHIPVDRVLASASLLKNMNANVTEKIYNNMGHTINEDEIFSANNIVFK
ncbi:MAG: dienelactone hydrolase family protein [Bacteroidota bacterium]|nr:dienelactone hydrolase family protein [Bacteroidota bacterium]